MTHVQALERLYLILDRAETFGCAHLIGSEAALIREALDKANRTAEALLCP